MDNSYPLLFVDYNIMVPVPGIILLDKKLDPNQLHVQDGDTFQVSIINGQIALRGISRKQNNDSRISQPHTSGS